MKRNSKKLLALLLALVLVVCSGMTVFGAQPTTEANERELRNRVLARKAATEGMVLLENNGVLPISNRGNIALYGVGIYLTVKGGTGSGAVNNRNNINVIAGFRNAGYNITTNQEYYNYITSISGTNYAGLERALTDATVQPTAATDTAIYVPSRNSGESNDRAPTKGDYYLNDTEVANIQKLGETYKNVIVVLNTGGIVDTKFFDEINAATTDPYGGDAIDSLFLMSQAGQEGGNALVQVLNGEVTPSAKLTDTWAYDYYLYPASATIGARDGITYQEDYVEGLYVGYRYFDSFAKELPDNAVSYPFGYGLSYTDFDISIKDVKADMDNVTVDVVVTNVGGTYSGKEVVEVYYSAPQGAGKLDKPYQELFGFGKTDTLAPGESQTLTISSPTTQMASYDEAKAAYVMDAGDYVLRVGNSSRDTEVAAVINLPATTITEQLSTQLDDQTNGDDEWTSDPANFYSYAGEAAEIAAAKKFTLDTAGFVAPNNASEYEQDIAITKDSPYYTLDRGMISTVNVYLDPADNNYDGTNAAYQPRIGEVVVPTTTKSNATLYDVYNGEITLEQFVAGLDVDQLARIVIGGSLGGSVPQAVGTAGYTTFALEDLGIAQTSLGDGPAGLRITQSPSAAQGGGYQYCTAWPIGTMLAQTWNVDLVNEVMTALGEEMVEYGATVWLAPGINIHRDPMCGRNFEYYSEDPYLVGMMAIAAITGIQSHPGIGVSLKHYAANNQEVARSSENNTINEHAFREIYLKGFEMAVKASQPMTIMSSYNRNQGFYSAGDYDTLYDIPRGEWDYEGYIMTDWGGVRAGIVNCMYGGNDLITPGSNAVTSVSNALRGTVAPSIDRNGLPVYWMRTFADGSNDYLFNTMGSFVMDPNGTAVPIVTNVTSSSVNGTNSSQINGVTVARFGTSTAPDVNAAYINALELLTSSAFTTAQRSAISISNVVRDASNLVTSYTVTIKGNYEKVMRLGDVQRSAYNILKLSMNADTFEKLAKIKGVDGIEVVSFNDLYSDILTTYTTVEKSDVVSAGKYTVKIGQTVTVPIKIGAGAGLAGGEGVVSYDSDILSLESVTSASGFTLQSNGDKFNFATTDGMNVTGDVIIGYAVLKAKTVLDDANTVVSFEIDKGYMSIGNQKFATVYPVAGAAVVTVLVETLAGDVNLDGKVDLADAILLLQYISKNTDLTSRQLRAADVTSDGAVNTADVIVIMQMCLN